MESGLKPYIVLGLMKIENGSKVTVKYSIYRQGSISGAENVKSFKATFEVGKGEIIPVIERVVLGHKAGDAVTLEVSGSEIFGPYDERKIVPIPLDRLDTDGPLKPGDYFHYRDEENRIHPFRVKKVEGNIVWADFNHPFGDETFLLNLIIEDVQ